MIDVELSNIWGSVSLPDLLSGEKDLFDAHMQLRTNQPDGPDFLGWLNAPEGVMARAVLSIGKAAERIAELGDTLVIVGSRDAPAAAQAASNSFTNAIEIFLSPAVGRRTGFHSYHHSRNRKKAQQKNWPNRIQSWPKVSIPAVENLL